MWVYRDSFKFSLLAGPGGRSWYLVTVIHKTEGEGHRENPDPMPVGNFPVAHSAAIRTTLVPNATLTGRNYIMPRYTCHPFTV